jgi:asparagine synthase (glutamine-hydrolysing)
MNSVLEGIKIFLHKSVQKRMMTERPVGCLLSGGLDSSLIASLVRNYLPSNKQLRTFSIGFEGSPDLAYARKVATFLKSDHHEFLVTPQEFLDHIDEVIAVTETYDITTIRASVGNYLVCKKIKEYNQTQDVDNQSIVIFNGDGADEVAGGYLYHNKAPSGLDFHYESVNLLKDISYFDVLRSDRSCSDNGLEPRTPFLDRDFVNFYMSIPIEYRFNNTKQEKYLIREAFKNDNLLPEEVLFRKKEAFSDGVSIKEKSWWEIIQDYLSDKVSIPDTIPNYPFDSTKLNKESYYYYKKYSELYKNQINVIPRYWLPKWSGNITNPSARILVDYK